MLGTRSSYSIEKGICLGAGSDYRRVGRDSLCKNLVGLYGTSTGGCSRSGGSYETNLSGGRGLVLRVRIHHAHRTCINRCAKPRGGAVTCAGPVSRTRPDDLTFAGFDRAAVARFQ